MKAVLMKRLAVLALFTAALIRPSAAKACAMCYGQSDSPLAVAMNWGIASLMVVVVGVLSAFALFGFYLVRKAAAVAAAEAAAQNAAAPKVS